MRKISISNYRNIGIDAPAELKIPQDGGLIVLLGENNVGKSNVLSAIYALQNRILDKSDEPNFLDSVEKPYIKYTPKTPKDTNVLSYTNEVEICFDDLEKIITWYLENSYNIVGNSKIANDRIKIYNLRKEINKASSEKNFKELKGYYEQLCTISRRLKEYCGSLQYGHREIILPDPITTNEIKKNNTKMPNIFFYQEKEIKNLDLQTKPDSIADNQFFQALFRAAGIDIVKVQTSYEISKEKETTSFYKKAEKDVNKSIKDTVNKRFNELYYKTANSEIYEFEVVLEAENISLSITKNGEPISLSEQSVGFKKFFNLFFNFLYQDKVGNGDVVLIDEVENHLSIPAQKDIRKFLKEFGQKRGITFIVSTHSNHILDIRHLDEIRIVKSSSKGSTIVNDFSIIPDHEADTLAEIKRSLGVEYLSLVGYDDKLIFVEGITDYNYLTAMNFLYEKERNSEEKLLFLPISGLGKVDNKTKNSRNTVATPTQEKIANGLKTLARMAKDGRALLLVDDDKAGEAMAKLKDNKFIAILNNEQFKEKYPNFKEIEDFFSTDLRTKFEMDKKSSAISSKFKNEVERGEIKIDKETKENFFKLFNYLLTF
ncbi:AAA family ATPase [uncultured Campylobacter sp.]|uniref:AAA family ATPase n=1 Tax=uncultured Campylobacter sp. TaxID=218934 RepID=UPI0028E65FA0|nr:AAA family ATPase [uncultured Campylobacter sp.]